MNEQNDGNGSEKQQKRAWQAPVMEELDIAATQAAYGPYGTADAGIYTT